MVDGVIKILIADDQLMVRQGLVALLKAQPNYRLVGEASDGREMVELTDKYQPDVILADVNMPNLNGIEATNLIRKRYPSINVILLSDAPSPQKTIRGLRYGAQGYLIKSDDFQQVIDAIQMVSQGRRYLSEAIVNQIVNAIVAGENLNEERLNEKISMREREILQLIAEGNTSAQIGEKLVISTRTVETHRMNLMKKLGLVSQVDIVRFAVRQGLVSLD